jgi:hypothetical protein
MKTLGAGLAALTLLYVVGCRVTVHPEPIVVVHEGARSGPPPAEVIIVQEPPAPRAEVIIGVAPSPNHVWVGGYWGWNGSAHVWVQGAWHPRPRPGAVWVEGRWERRGNGWVRVEGRWR